MLRGFQLTDDASLSAPYAARYFAELTDVVERLEGEMGRGFAALAFPRRQISDEAVGLVDVWLAEDRPQALRRAVIEGRDRLVRALRARACDRAAV
jgi:aminopeptidase N